MSGGRMTDRRAEGEVEWLRGLLGRHVLFCMTCKGTGTVFVGDSADLNEDRYTIETCPDCSDAREALTGKTQ